MAPLWQSRMVLSDDGPHITYSGTSEMNQREAFRLVEVELEKARHIVEILEKVSNIKINEASQTLRLILEPPSVPKPQSGMNKRGAPTNRIGHEIQKRARPDSAICDSLFNTPAFETPATAIGSFPFAQRQHTKPMADQLQPASGTVPRASRLYNDTWNELEHGQAESDEEPNDPQEASVMTMSRNDSNTTASNSSVRKRSGVKYTAQNRQLAYCLERTFNTLLHIQQHGEALQAFAPKDKYTENVEAYAFSDWTSTMADPDNIDVIRPLLNDAGIQACRPPGVNKEGMNMRWILSKATIFAFVKKLMVATKTQNPKFYDRKLQRINDVWGTDMT